MDAPLQRVAFHEVKWYETLKSGGLAFAPGLPGPTRFLGPGNGTQHAPPSRGRGGIRVTHVIAEPCIGVKDKGCVDVCPVDCIHEGEEMLYIDPTECIDCGLCVPECPVDAIFFEDDLPEKWKDYIQINADFFK